jgi:hypothetical protein
MPLITALTYRTTGAWGTGTGSDLVNSAVDTNFWDLVQNDQYLLGLINGFITTPPTSIADFIVSGDSFFVELTNHTMLGPYTLPAIDLNFVGAWQPSTPHSVNTVFDINGTVYVVVLADPGQVTFDPGANDGNGHNYFQVLFSMPGNVLPTGGTVGQVLTATSIGGIAVPTVAWATMDLSALGDVTLTTLAVGNILRWNGSMWANAVPTLPTYTLENLTDVQILSPLDSGDLLQWNDSKWVNSTIAALGITYADVSGTLTYASISGTANTVSSLFAPAVGIRDFVTDATVNTFGAPAVGGGAFAMPVWSDGTGWFIG